jgi:peptidoglycan/LPS O-acetylase OafA/YrhL
MVMGFSLVAICTALLLVTGTIKQERKYRSANKFKQMICWFGKNSYELYLFHIIILALMRTIYPSGTLGNYSKLLWMAIFFLISSILAEAIAKRYSQPANKNIRQSLFGLRQQDDIQTEYIQGNRLP